MNNSKKLFASILAALILASTGTMAWAKNYDDVKDDHPVRSEISILSDIGVIKGTEENIFSPDEDVTREQMATLLFRLMLGRDDAGRVNTSKFTDLYEPYYNGAISWANASGFIFGTSETTFSPTGGITKQDAMTMLVRALGQDTDKMNDGYPWSYINAGVKLGLDKGLADVAYDEVLTRAETAQILYNALTSEYLVGRTTVNGNVYIESTSIIEEVFGFSMAYATVIATNDYALDGETVVKNGYVTLLADNGEKEFKMTVPFAEMNLDGEANDHLGHSFKVIYKTNYSKYEILSTVDETKTEAYTSVKIDGNKVVIGENKYTLVEEYSDELSTNNNELMLFAYGSDGKLEQIKTTAELSELLGFYKITLMFNGSSELSSFGVVRVYEMDKLTVTDGKYNIGGGKSENELSFTNDANAEDGDFVLYYYNSAAAELEIAEVLDIVSGTVKRITNTSVKIGDETYELGNETAGITAQSLKNKLTLGTNAVAVAHSNSIVAIVDGTEITNSSNYLLSVSDAHRVYENGAFRYVMSAYVDGEEKNIYVNDANAKAGNIFRYTESSGNYTLIAPSKDDGIILSGKNQFVQNSGGVDEIAYIITSADGTTIELSGRNYYTISKGSAEANASVAGLDGMNFITDKNTVIIVNDGGKLMQRSGAYSSTITVKDGSSVTAIFDNETGSVETLKYLYISDGSLGNYDLDAGFVRILENVGQSFENGKAYTEYLVYNFSNGKIETMLSLASDLEDGADYRLGDDATVTSDKADVVAGGFVTGFTSGTVSVDGHTYTLSSEVKVIRITSDNRLENVSLSALYMKNIEIIAEKGVVSLIIEAEEAEFTVAATSTKVTVTPDFDLANFAELTVTPVSIKSAEAEITADKITAAKGEENTIGFTLAEGEALADGVYTLTFKLGSKQFALDFEAETPEEAE